MPAEYKMPKWAKRFPRCPWSGARCPSDSKMVPAEQPPGPISPGSLAVGEIHTDICRAWDVEHQWCELMMKLGIADHCQPDKG